MLSEFGETPDCAPEAVLVVARRQWLDAVRTWLVSEEFDCVDLACPADLRAGIAAHSAAILVGHPVTAYSSAFRPPGMAVREYGWMLTAPAAPLVRLVLTADAPELRTDEAWLLPAPAHPPLSVEDPGPPRSNVPHDWLPVLDPTAPVQHTPRPTPTAAADQAFGFEVHLASGHAVFYDTEVGPRPLVVVVDDDTGAVALSAAPVSTITRGSVLAVRVGAAPHEQVVNRADTWLQGRRGWSAEQIAEVRGCGLTSASRSATFSATAFVSPGHQALHRELTRTLPDEYARVLLHNPLDELYIAPQRRAGFEALIAAIGAHNLTDRFDDLATVRTAHQQAGEEIRKELLTLLRDRRWVGDMDEDGWTVLHAGELGALLLAVVTARLDEPVPVARTWLGGLVAANGRRVTRLAPSEGTT